MKHGKKYQDSSKLFDSAKLYDTAEAIDLCTKTAKEIDPYACRLCGNCVQACPSGR